VNASTNFPRRLVAAPPLLRLLVADGHAIVLAVTAPAHTPNLANGLTAFNAGGCSSCHACPASPIA